MTATTPGKAPLESVGLRRAQFSDVAALVALERAVGGTSLGWRELFRDRSVFTYLIEDVEPFGFITAGSPRDPELAEPDTGEIIRLVVRADRRGYGIGRKLLVHGISVLRRRHFDAAAAWLPESAREARAVYEALGFESTPMMRETNREDGTVLRECWFRIDCSGYF